MFKVPMKVVAATLLLAISAQLHAQDDQLLQILQQELKYNFAELQKQEVKPYFMSYRAEDVKSTSITSSFGVLSGDNVTHRRIVTPQIRVGDMQLDNFKYSNQAMPQGKSRTAPVVAIPFSGDVTDGVRADIWKATLSRYQLALAAYQDARSKALTTTADEDKAPCFSKASVETYYEAPLPVSQTRIDRKAWEERLNAVSAVFKAEPSLKTGSATLNFDVSRTWLVNTDGTSVVQNRIAARVMIDVKAQADDGMELPIMQDFFAFSLDSLPSQEAMVAVAKDLLKRVMALKNAPVANPYTGPAILSGSASGVFFHEIFGHRLEGHRLKQGGETFRKMVGKEVLPTTFQVFCDPTLKKYHGQDLNGHYLYDSEGVKARRVDNVVDGVLKEFLMSRVPLDGFPQSNGHGRAAEANDAVSRQSNLCVETNAPETDAQLRHELRQECQRQGREYGYYFKTVTSGYTMTGEQGSINSFNVTPVEVYRVYVDGRPDELVRGVSLIGTPLSMFSHIKYGGDTPSTFTGVCGAESGWVPVTANSPAIFVTQIETQRMQKSRNIPSILGAPADTASLPASASEGDIIRQAMIDEMHRSLDSLNINGQAWPFWVSYILNRNQTFSVQSELGGITACDFGSWKSNMSVQVRIGNFRKTSDLPGRPAYAETQAAGQVDYGNIRRALWQASDVVYKGAIQSYYQKGNLLKQHPLPSALADIPDMQRSAAVTYSAPVPSFDVDTVQMQTVAKELSAIFKDYPQLFNTQVDLKTVQMHSYRVTSENVNLMIPHSYVEIRAVASFKDADNVSQTDDLTLHYLSPADVPSLDDLKGKVRKFADDCVALGTAPDVQEYYKGPVMLAGEASMRAFTANYLKPNAFMAIQSLQMPKNSFGERIGKKVMDERFTIRNLTSLKEYDGVPLYGHYDIDADGFRPAAEMTLVDKGVFKMMLNRATPALYANRSTGSAFFNNDPGRNFITTSIGILDISAEGTTSEDKMEKELMKAAKKEKLDCAYIMAIPENASIVRLYQVDLKTGNRKLVKSNQISFPNEDQMRDLLAVSGSRVVKNTIQPSISSIIYPQSIILKDGEVGKAAMQSGHAAPIPYPLLRDANP